MKVLGYLLLGCALAGLGFAVTQVVMRRFGPGESFVLGLGTGMRNTGLLVAAMGSACPPDTYLFFSLLQFPDLLRADARRAAGPHHGPQGRSAPPVTGTPRLAPPSVALNLRRRPARRRPAWSGARDRCQGKDRKMVAALGIAASLLTDVGFKALKHLGSSKKQQETHRQELPTRVPRAGKSCRARVAKGSANRPGRTSTRCSPRSTRTATSRSPRGIPRFQGEDRPDRLIPSQDAGRLRRRSQPDDWQGQDLGRAIFSALDTDKNGALSRNELAAAVQHGKGPHARRPRPRPNRRRFARPPSSPALLEHPVPGRTVRRRARPRRTRPQA